MEYGHISRREDSDVLQKALEFKLDGQKKIVRPKMTWRTQVEKETEKVGLRQDDASNQTKWRKGVKKMVMRCVATTIHGETPHQKNG